MTDELLSAKREKYPVNKGIGRPVEFKGLKAQYLFLLQAGCSPPSSCLSSCTRLVLASGSASASAS